MMREEEKESVASRRCSDPPAAGASGVAQSHFVSCTASCLLGLHGLHGWHHESSDWDICVPVNIFDRHS